jgi:SecD/SecF fusion protein
MGIKAGSERKKVFNESLNTTLSRTLITSLTTLVVVLVLFLFGGAVLKGFSFALLVGIIVGTYSSIFIATPIVIDLYDKQDSKTPV